jgi:hypothetical protein
MDSEAGDVSGSAPDGLSFFIQNGITPVQVKPFMDVLSQQQPDGSGYWATIEEAWPYYQKGYSPADSLTYSAQNIPVDQVQHYLAQQKQQQQETTELQNNITRLVNSSQCGGTLYDVDGTVDDLDLPAISTSATSMTSFSPFAVNGKCFFEDIEVTQWNGQNGALVNNNNMYVDFPNPPQTNSVSAIVQGESSYVYTAVSGAQLTVPRAIVLMYVQQ